VGRHGGGATRTVAGATHRLLVRDGHASNDSPRRTRVGPARAARRGESGTRSRPCDESGRYRTTVRFRA
jgi:hypothetical protein